MAVSNSMRSRREVNIFTLFRQFKYGHKNIDRIQRLLTPHYGVIAGILGAGMGMAGLYMVLLDKKLNLFSKRSVSEAGEPCNYMVAGLQNLGNNCFLNVILQALASCGSFLPFLRSMSISDDQMMEEEAEEMPLLFALMRIIDELSVVRSEKTIFNPRHVMNALSSHIGNFNLMSQQDAAESLLHILSSLELEILQRYVPHRVSLAKVGEYSSKICKVMENGGNESERWREHVFGPFDGATGSVLKCRNCSSVLSMDFENFRCLSVPVFTKAGAITDSCTLESCLRQFTTVEQLESYSCTKCWHIAALKYLSQREGNNELQLNRVRHCLHLESCDCQNLFSKEEVLPTGFSRASKQLIVARCPKILCIHLQRASMNEYGDFLKIQGHISFPFFLDLSPYVKAEMTLEREASLESKGKWNRQQIPLTNYLIEQNRQQETQLPARTIGAESGTAVLDILSTNKSAVSVKLSGDSSGENVLEDSNENAISKSEMVFPDCSGGCSKDEAHYGMKVSHTAFLQSSKSYLYSLSSVVEHYGKFGSGHYGVYRRVVTNSDRGNFVGPIRSDNRQWLYVSDSTVSNVDQEDVFAAEASLLFYQRLD